VVRSIANDRENKEQPTYEKSGGWDFCFFLGSSLCGKVHLLPFLDEGVLSAIIVDEQRLLKLEVKLVRLRG
jgi:hypothetical protein